MSPSKLILITGTDLRHHYVQNRIHREFPLHVVFYEKKIYPEAIPQSKEEESAWQWFFDRREKYEAETFALTDFPAGNCDPHTVNLEPGTLNSQETFNILDQADADLILLFDTSMVKESLLNRYSGRIWNLHMGLSDRYRGSSCNFWPIHDRRLDCLGATILTIDPGIDTGAILAQGITRRDKDDTEQTLMGKTIMLGAELMLEALRNRTDGNLTARPLTQRGALFQKKDFQPNAVLKVRQWVESSEWPEAIQPYSANAS